MSEISLLLSDVLGGHRLTEAEATRLMDTRERNVFKIASAADEMRERYAGDIVTFVKNQNLHVTNICKNLCGFCGFGRSAEDEGAYCNDKAAIQAKTSLALERGVTWNLSLSRVHPEFTVDTYCDLISWVHEIDRTFTCTRSARMRSLMQHSGAIFQALKFLKRLKFSRSGIVTGNGSRDSCGLCEKGNLSQKTGHSRMGANNQRSTRSLGSHQRQLLCYRFM